VHTRTPIIFFNSNIGNFDCVNLYWPLYAGLSVKNRNVLERVVKVCGKIVGERQKSLTELYESRVVRKATSILSDETHVLAKHFELLPSGRRFRVPKMSKVRKKSSFIPSVANQRWGRLSLHQ
jgi:hypothetical protein